VSTIIDDKGFIMACLEKLSSCFLSTLILGENNPFGKNMLFFTDHNCQRRMSTFTKLFMKNVPELFLNADKCVIHLNQNFIKVAIYIHRSVLSILTLTNF